MAYEHYPREGGPALLDPLDLPNPGDRPGPASDAACPKDRPGYPREAGVTPVTLDLRGQFSVLQIVTAPNTAPLFTVGGDCQIFLPYPATEQDTGDTMNPENLTTMPEETDNLTGFAAAKARKWVSVTTAARLTGRKRQTIQGMLNHLPHLASEPEPEGERSILIDLEAVEALARKPKRTTGQRKPPG